MHHHHTHTPRRPREKAGRGASRVEYALLLALIATVVFSAVSYFGTSNGGGFGKSACSIQVAYQDTGVCS